MAQFSVNAQRFDPYKNFKFRVKWDGKYVSRREQGQCPEAHDRGGGRRSSGTPAAAGSRLVGPNTNPSHSSEA